MASMSIRFYSTSLNRNYTFQMIIPNDIVPNEFVPASEYSKRPMKVLFLLHGYTGDAGNWVPEDLCAKYNFAIVVPNGENSFWLDAKATGHQYATLVGVELVEYVRKTFGLAKNPEDTCILGLSMGGFGALHTGLAYPDTFGKIGAMSSALLIHEVAGMSEDSNPGNAVANYEYYREIFGEPSKLLESRNNPETLVDEILSERKKMPGMYICCGTEDFLLENNRQFHNFLESRAVKHEYKESAGTHSMDFWMEYTKKIIPWMFEE